MFGELTFSFQNILDANGTAIAVTGLSIVFTSLTLITLAIAAMPRILVALERFLPPEHEHHHTAPAAKPADDELLAVAIGFAMHKQGKAKDKNR